MFWWFPRLKTILLDVINTVYVDEVLVFESTG